MDFYHSKNEADFHPAQKNYTNLQWPAKGQLENALQTTDINTNANNWLKSVSFFIVYD